MDSLCAPAHRRYFGFDLGLSSEVGFPRFHNSMQGIQDSVGNDILLLASAEQPRDLLAPIRLIMDEWQLAV